MKCFVLASKISTAFRYHGGHAYKKCKLIYTITTHLGPAYWHGWTLIPPRINNHMPRTVWDQITCQFPKFNGCKFENRWIISSHTHIIYNYLSMLGSKLIHDNQRVPSRLLTLIFCQIQVNMYRQRAIKRNIFHVVSFTNYHLSTITLPPNLPTVVNVNHG